MRVLWHREAKLYSKPGSLPLETMSLKVMLGCQALVPWIVLQSAVCKNKIDCFDRIYTVKKLSNCGPAEDSSEFLGLQGDQMSQS